MNNKPIAFLVKTYPKVSETFILNEILALEKKGLNLHIFSLCQPSDDSFHSITSCVRAKVTYSPSTFLPDVDKELEHYLPVFNEFLADYPGLTGYRITQKNNPKPTLLYQAAFLALSIKRLGIAHIHAHFASEPTSVAELVHLITGVSYSISAHAKDIYLSPPEILRRKIALASFVVTCTDYNRRYLESINDSNTPIHCVYHGLDTTCFKPSSNNKISTVPKLLSVGRFREKKGFRYLIEACKLLKERGYEFHCEIIGYGPEQARLEDLIQEFGLKNNVSLTGILIHDDLKIKYAEATIFVLPCIVGKDGDRDGIPNVLLEAMAMEKPVISTRVSGIPEIIEQLETGFLVQEKDSKALAAVIALLFNEPSFGRAIGKSARIKICDQFSPDRNILLLLNFAGFTVKVFRLPA